MDDTTVFGGDEPQVMDVMGGLDEAAVLTEAETGEMALERAMEEVDVTRLSEEGVADLESGDERRIEAAIREARRPAGEDEGRMPGRISLRAIESREERRGLIEATRMLRDGEAGTLREALGRVFEFGGEMGDEIGDGVGESARGETEQGTNGDRLADGAGIAASAGQGSAEGAYEGGGAATVLLAEERLEGLVRERAARMAGYDYEGADELLAEMVEARMEVKQARRTAETEAAYVTEYEAQEAASRGQVERMYGELMGSEESLFNTLLGAEILLAEQQKDPIFKSADWPENIARRTMEKHGAYLGGGAADPERLSGSDLRMPKAPRTGVRMPGSPVGGGANSMALTASAAMTEFEKLSPEEQRDVLDQLDKKRL
ncbi:hypothetical protein EI77_04707 [Prosthecobacter fusiformis]|uniref:Uncharacterized protein n=1 Tax=Prosthecobacter fusiformis TaxID=48464 RepID=A0A4R7RID6_9BACT|nr:hypothetical protein [Prosthecobacter fusiformis]TDU62483.1 hypothetical protein EI77_04707 [Prosthecobacter fusiformis]